MQRSQCVHCYHKMGVFPLKMNSNNKIICPSYFLPNSGLVMNFDASRLLGKLSLGVEG